MSMRQLRSIRGLRLSGFDHEDSNETQVHATLERIEGLTNDEDYAFAHDTLTGIYSTIETRQRVTPGQLRAIENIENSRSNRRF